MQTMGSCGYGCGMSSCGYGCGMVTIVITIGYDKIKINLKISMNK